MKKPIKLDLNIENKSPNSKSYQVQPWVNTAIEAKNNPITGNVDTSAPKSKLLINMNICQSILNRR